MRKQADISMNTPSSAQTTDALSNRTSAFRQIVKRYGGIVCALLVLVVLFSALSPNFLVANNLINIVLQVSIIAIVAFGMTYVLLLGEIDLSVGAIIAFVGGVAAQLLALDLSPVVVIPLALLAGTLLGFVNGSLSAFVSIPSFIVTVATMGIFRGITFIASDGMPVSIASESFLWLGNGTLGGVPTPVCILVALLAINHFVLSKTVFGRKTYLTGGNREAAIYAGVKVNALKIKIFMLSGLMSAVGGLILTARLYSAQPNAAMGYELDAIAAAVLGGTSLTGGYGTMVGTVIGALIIGVINNGMNLLSVPYFYQLIVKGVVILVAVGIDVQNKKHRA